MALEAIRWSLEPADAPPPTLEEARRTAASGGETTQIVGMACTVMERVAVCTLDGRCLSAWIDLHAGLEAPQLHRDDPSEIALVAAGLWKRLLGGDTAGLDTAAKAVFDDASRQNAGAAVIESTVIRALVAVSEGALSDAIELGRRASRMAQAEALSHHEYLASIVLARVRRYSGRPHLALHILAALRRVAPRTWSGWIGWEAQLAGALPTGTKAAPDVVARELDESPSAIAQRRLRDLLTSARNGDRPAFDTATAALEEAAGIWPHMAQEVAALLAALDPNRPAIPDSMASWCRGEAAIIPYGLHGVGIPQDAGPQTETATAYVVAQPGEKGRRFLFPGLPLAPGARMLARDSVRSGARTETGIAALALAGPSGKGRDSFFRSVYGFSFVPYRHRAVLDVLCHRMRILLGDAGEIRRDGGDSSSGPGDSLETSSSTSGEPAIALALERAIVVPDMRCVLPTADRVLRALATLGATSASAAADRLRMPLRTVQAVLQQLVAEGACTVERDGRRVAYCIEDTTFTAVTTSSQGTSIT